MLETEGVKMAARSRAPGLVLAAAVLLVVAACGGGGEEAPPTSSAVGPGISVEEALASDLAGPLLVNGFIVATGDEVRLCGALAESFPPQCGGASLRVEGLDLASLTGLSSEGDVTWSDEAIQVLGSVGDGTITVEAQAQA